MILCPLCQSNCCAEIDRVMVADLDYFYRAKFKVTIVDEFDSIEDLRFYSCGNCSLRFFWPMVAGSAKFYQGLNRNRWYYLLDKSEFETASAVIPMGAAVLDIGCGEGKFARHLSSCQYTGLEKYLTTLSNRGDLKPRILPETIEEHAVKHAGEYDVVCSFQVMEHVTQVKDFIENSLRCLKPKGLLILSVPSADSYVAQTINGILNMPPHHLSWWPDASLEFIALNHRLTLLSIKHEMLEKSHYRRYAFNRAFSKVSRLLGRRSGLIDRSLIFKVLSSISLPLAAIELMALFISPAPIIGHSVVAVYRKDN